MHKNLIIAAFEKAKVHAQLEGITNPSKSHLATLLADFLMEDVKFSITERRLRDYYNEAIVLVEEEDIKIAQQDAINGLCHYIDCETYQDFLNVYKLQPISNSSLALQARRQTGDLGKMKPYKTVILFLLSTVVLIIFIIKTQKQRWMIWNGETFEETSFESDSLKSGVLQLYSEEQINKFTKLSKCDCDTKFFNTDGSVKIWYYKNKDGTLDCFNSTGLHPETGKTLKPITVYMIRKYLCEGY